LLTAEFAIAKDLGEKTWTDRFTRMNWHHGRSTVTVAEKVVTTLHPYHFVPHLY